MGSGGLIEDSNKNSERAVGEGWILDRSDLLIILIWIQCFLYLAAGLF